MKIFFTLIVAFLIGITSNAQTVKKVLIIGIDGCRSDALQVADTPNIDQLISNGIYSPDALNTDVTSSGPGWSAILTGVWSDKNGVNSNDFSNSNYDEYPPLMKYVNEFSADMHTVSIVHWGPINDEIIQENSDLSFNFGSDEEVSTTAANYLSVNDPDMMFLHFDDVDHAGHFTGFTPTNLEYIEAIEQVDILIEPILDAIVNRETYNNEDWLILVTTDHGGNGTSHGGSSFGERNIFVIASSNSIPIEVILADSSVTTIQNCLEETSALYFDGEDDFVEIPENPLFDFGTSSDFTVECRIRTQEATDVSIVGNKDWDSGLSPGYVFSFSQGTWKVNIGDGSSREDINGGVVSDNQWHTLSASFDRDGEMKMYQDGVFMSSTNISTIGNINTGAGLFFGTDILSDYDYTGYIAEVRVWDQVIEETNILDWQCSALSETHPDYDHLIGYWKLNNSDEDIATDSSINLNDGTIIDAEMVETEAELIFDYSDTPRSVDVSITALTHLCIPILESWDLDGVSLIPECSTTNVVNLTKEQTLTVYPTVIESKLFYQLPTNNNKQSFNIQIFSSLGELVYENSTSEPNGYIGVGELKKGNYIIKIHNEKHNLVSKIVKI